MMLIAVLQFDFAHRHEVTFRDAPIRAEEREGRLLFATVLNDGSTASYRTLTGLKNLFQKQLPKMPREYISRLVYDRAHGSLAVIRPGTGAVIGGITYRLFVERGFCEIVFCAISSAEQVKGFGAALMNQLKERIRILTDGRVQHYLTYADNYAIGYFKKQGFTRRVNLDRSVWGGYIKDYDGGTLMQCTIVPGVAYLDVHRMLHRQKMHLARAIDAVTGCARVYGGLQFTEPDDACHALDPLERIPGLAAAGWTPEMSRAAEDTPRRGRLYEMLRPLLNELQAHPAAWPFLRPVNAEEVPSYYQAITRPMDLSSMDAKLESDRYGTLPEFIADFNLIVANCRAFNAPDTSYCKNAANLERFFQERLRARNSRAL